ncbi:MAG: NAD(P)/FAD-dependent oxidoreductase [Candidatus Polarisedimenticolia bacterium]
MRRYDVVVLGGAFAGSATALLLKRSDPRLRVLIVEKREAFDRKVGESAIELSTWFLTRVLRLDRHMFLEQLPKYGQRYWFFKEGVTGLSGASELGNKYQTRVPSFHVDRARLDEHVHGLARAEGVEVMRPAKVMDMQSQQDGLSTLLLETPDGPQSVEASWVVDGTGRTAWLARRMGLLEAVPEHPTHAVWARYTGTADLDGEWLPGREGQGAPIVSRGLSTNHFTGLGWWVWIIPLPGGDVSVGVVWDERLFDLPPGANLADRFESFMRSYPAGMELMRNTRRREGDFRSLRHLPYRVRRIMGNGWAMVGDAAGFIDPFYSPGLDWAACTISRTVSLIVDDLAAGGKPETRRAAVERHSSMFTLSFERWLRALYVDKYYYMGDAELMEVALRLEVALYYFGIVTPAYREPHQRLIPPFSLPISWPFYALIRGVNDRLAALAKVRLAAGTYGRGNAGRRVMLGGFKLGPSSLRFVPGALARLARLEIGSLPDRLAARRRRREELAGRPAAAMVGEKPR